VLAGKKFLLKNGELTVKNVPRYAEISVKNLYADALGQPDVAKYLPDKEHMKNRLPERNFFFGVLSATRH